MHASMRYPGGKGRCYQHIISMMPEHRIFIETHLGGGAVLRHKRPAEVSIGVDLDPEVIAKWRSIEHEGLLLKHADAHVFLKDYRFTGDELIYCDPPYLPETRRRKRIYRCEYSIAQHVELLRLLKNLPCNVILSGYRSKIYDETLLGWRSVEFPGDSQVGPRTEVAWLNFDPPAVLHDHAYLGEDFRARERIKRRRRGLVSRVGSLTDAERRALFVELAGVHRAEMIQATRADLR
jgi:DNA adenine methylase